MIEITEIDPVWSKINQPHIIKPLLRYKHEWWKPGPFKKERKETIIDMISGKGEFLTGFTDKVVKYLEEKGADYRLETQHYGVEIYLPGLPGIVFRDYQKTAIDKCRYQQRGIWVAPTAAGKTIIMMGILRSYKNSPTLILVHTKTLFNQIYEDLNNYFPCQKIGRIGAGIDDPQEITVGIIKSVAAREMSDWEMVMVDECHHVNNLKSLYSQFFQKTKAPIRFGFTATLPKDQRGLLTLEGLIGPVIGTTSHSELMEKGVLAVPRVKILEVPDSGIFRDLTGTYQEIYEKAIVNHRRRNMEIVTCAKWNLKTDMSVLIMIEYIEHGNLLQKYLGDEFVFLHGGISDKVVEEEKEKFSNKTRMGVIASRIWCEGTNIPSIGAIINASGGLSDTKTIQKFGRGLRKAEGKSEVWLYDFADQHHRHFQKHTLERLLTYVRLGWLK